MSLLPGSILFPSMPVGKIETDHDGKPTGRVLIEMNWWLFFYNISQQVLGTPGGGASVGLPAAGLIEIASLEAAADDADAIAARVLASSTNVFAQDTTSDADIAKLKSDVNTALMYAQDALLPDTSSSVSPASPTSLVGTTAIPGTKTTYMRSDAAPAVNQAITPTWTGAHTFSPTSGVTSVVDSAANAIVDFLVSATSNVAGSNLKILGNGGTTPSKTIRVITGILQILNDNYTTVLLQITDSGNATFSGPVGVNNASPPAQVTGFGTPTGTGVINNFPGATATLAQCSQAIAEIIKDLKAFGLYGT